MPEDPSIQVRHLGKRYTIGGSREKYLTLRDAIADSLKRPFGALAKPRSEEFFALRDVSFDVMQGEVVGIIGRNGAGKSTLLKILSRITPPTEGTVHLYGRVGSLLEVGTGFHPELTGRENIFLSGSILGMRKREIEAKLDDIVAFSEIGKFLDTPAKRYSSGMYVRLAFAVAAHLDPEILLVDEVLAVGDAAFQKKCLGKMGEVAKEGRTVLFVSHNMAAVQRLCPRTIWLDRGTIAADGTSDGVIDRYLSSQKDTGSGLCARRDYDPAAAPGDESVRLRRVELVAADRSSQPSFHLDEGFCIEIESRITKPVTDFQYYIRVHNDEGILVFCSAEWDGAEFTGSHHGTGPRVSRVAIPPHFLNTGTYTLTVMGLIHNSRVLFEETNVLTWSMENRGGVGGVVSIERKGLVRPLLRWSA